MADASKNRSLKNLSNQILSFLDKGKERRFEEEQEDAPKTIDNKKIKHKNDFVFNMEATLKKYKFFIPALLSFFTFNQCIQAESNYGTLINQIIANEYFCVQEYEEEKIYLRAENIYPTENGLLLKVNDQDYICLLLLQSDNTGCYVPLGRMKVLNTCRFCKKEYFIRYKNPECPLNKK